MMSIFIYTLCDPRTSHVRYVGLTSNLHSRLINHIQPKRNCRNKAKLEWIESLKSLGLLPVIEPIEECGAEAEARNAERFWINTLRFLGCDLVNLNNGGTGLLSHTDAVKVKISEAMKGRRVNAETRARMSVAQKGSKKRPLTDAQRRNLSAAMMGHATSAETRRKIAAKHRGKKYSAETLARMSAAQKLRFTR